MEYSLKQLNKISKLENLTLNDFIEKLNLIGLEIDDVILENVINPLRISDIKLIIKIPANRDDLLIENIILDELATILLFKLYNTWENLKYKYYFLIKQKYLQYSNYSISTIDCNLDHLLTYIIQVDNFKEKIVPLWVKNKLGIKSNENRGIIESLINLTFLEWGQNFNTLLPTNKLKIQYLEKEKTFSIHGDVYHLNKGSIILTNESSEILSVLGLLNYSFQNKNLFLEATFYDIDKNFLGLNDVNSKISFRYLRRNILTNFKFSFQRLLTLLEIITESSINSNIYKNQNKKLELNSYKLLKLNKNSFKNFLDIEKYDPSIFEKTNFKIVCETENTLYFYIPNFRKDLNREIDLIEEYARFIGYKNFKEIFPKVLKITPSENKNKKHEFIKQFFLNYNFNEIFTNSLDGEENITKNSILIQNPLNSDYCNLRSSLINNIIQVLRKNLKFGSSGLKFFEIGRIYKNEKNGIIEQDNLSTIFSIETKNNLDQNIDFFIAKGFIENFLSYFSKINFTFENEINDNKYYHPKKFLKILSNQQTIGYFGEINPKYKKEFSLKQNIYLFELNLDIIKSKNLKSTIKIYKEYSKYPTITKDLSILITKDTNFYQLKTSIQNEINNLKSINFFDIYFDNEQINQISLGIRLEFQSFIKTLITEEIENEIEKLNNLLITSFNAKLKI